MSHNKVTVEIVVYNIESAMNAEKGGADRIELCDNPGEGGTTPSYGTIELVRQNVTLDLFVMIRPRGGDFCYSSYEYHSMKRDISQCQKLSVDGVDEEAGGVRPEGGDPPEGALKAHQQAGGDPRPREAGHLAGEEPAPVAGRVAP